MASTIIFQLTSLDCIRATESEDEVYLNVLGEFLDNSSKITERFPKNENNIWVLKTGDKITGFDIYAGPLQSGIKFNFKLMEQDLKGLLSAIKGVDDLLGEVEISILTDGSVKVLGVKNVTILSSDKSDIGLSFQGEKGEYQIRMKIS